jgi:hypothetical protein
VPYDCCLFAVPIRSADHAHVLETRLSRLTQYFDAWSAVTTVRATVPGVFAGKLAFSAGPNGEASFVWGSVDGQHRADLRFVGPGSAIETDGHTVRWRTSPTDITSAYRCGDAVSTHAVVAAVLGAGRVRVRPRALAELLAFGHPANDAHVVDDVVALGADACLEFSSDGVDDRLQEAAPQLELVPDDAAYAHGVMSLHAALDACARRGRIALGLTAGRDSRVVASALREQGIDALTYTWGAGDAPDAIGAAAVARTLGLEHRTISPRMLGDDDIVPSARGAVTWTEGAAPIGVVDGHRELGVAVNITGAGGELGRAFHYAFVAQNRRDPAIRHLESLWQPHATLDQTVEPAAREHVRDVARAALQRAAVTGATGWRLLDVVYAQQRMRRWGRSGIAPTSDAAYLPAFLEPEVARALISLPLRDRLTDGFHRRYLSDHAPDLGLAAPNRQRAWVPPVARRVASTLRRRRPGAPPPADTVLFAAHYPETLSYLRDSVVTHPIVSTALGQAFADRLEGGLVAGDARAIHAALQLGGATLMAEVTSPLADVG